MKISDPTPTTTKTPNKDNHTTTTREISHLLPATHTIWEYNE